MYVLEVKNKLSICDDLWNEVAIFDTQDEVDKFEEFITADYQVLYFNRGRKEYLESIKKEDTNATKS